MTPELFCIGCTIKDASAQLRRMVGDHYFSIQMNLAFITPDEVETKWLVFDALTAKVHQGATLSEAANKCLIAIADRANELNPIRRT
jgi:hypothetical protein